jgi:hypothetical protein
VQAKERRLRNIARLRRLGVYCGGGANEVKEAAMTLVVLGVLLIFAGVVLAALKTIRQGRLSQPPDAPSDEARGTLEPSGRGRRLNLKVDLPGLTLFLLGAILLIVASAESS